MTWPPRKNCWLPLQDALIERFRKETDLPTRNTLIEKALLADHELVSHIPLHNQIEWRALKVN